MEEIIRAKAALQFCIDSGKKIETMAKNPAYLIYLDLHTKISGYDNLDEFMTDYFTIGDLSDGFLEHVTANYEKSEFIKENINTAKFHTLGDHIASLLAGRFVKETKNDSNISKEDHVINWFKLNANLNMETDRDIVQAGFLTIFFIKN